MSMEYIQKKELERRLSELLPFQSPKVDLEQYTTPEKIAAEILWLAAFTYNDIGQRTVLDLGSGTGIFGIGAAILGAARVVAVDIDPNAIKTGCFNTVKMGFKERVDWIAMEVDSVPGSYDTVIQNPPFGTRKRGVDLRFLQKALEIGSVVYSLHKSGIKNRELIKDFIDKHGGRVTGIFQNKFMLPRTLNFHKRKEYAVKVDLYRIVRKSIQLE